MISPAPLRFSPHALLRLCLALHLALQPALVPLAQAQGLPELGDAAQSDLSPQLEKKVGESIYNEIRQKEPTYLDDPEVVAYLDSLGSRLAAASPEPGQVFTFFLLEDPQINAFATFGGYVGVNSGLILAAQSESELAGVLAHEISHVTQHHLARGMSKDRQSSVASLAALAVAILAARSNSQVAQAAIVGTQAGALQSQLAFSRDFEREADRVGFQTLDKAGFDVRGMGEFFQRLQKASRLYENNAPDYLRTHPLTVERITDMQNRAQGAKYKQVPDSLDFQLVRAKLRARLATPKEAVTDFESLLKDRKFANEGATHYGLARAYLRANNYAGVERELGQLQKMKVSHAMVDNLTADLRLAQKDVPGALQVYRDGIKRYPFSRALAYGYGDTLLNNAQAREAQVFLEGQIQLYPQDSRLYTQVAKAYSLQGRAMQEHRALAESLALQGRTEAAIEQLQLAQRAADGNFYDQSVVDARLRELKAKQAEEAKEKKNGR